MRMIQSQVFDPSFIQRATGGSLEGRPGGDRVVTDSRDAVEGALFVALPGPRFDGHDFVEDVLGRGASGAVVSEAWCKTHHPQNALVVPDPLRALQSMAGEHRRRFPVPLVAITGSNGKTATKDLTASALAPLGNVLRTRGNRNNHIGLPLTLLELRGEHDAAVVEIGLNHPGELRELAALARPRVGVITNVAPAHLEGLGTLQGVARAKAEIAEALPADGTLVVPEDSPELEAALTGYSGRRIRFGLGDRADVRPLRVRSRGLEGLVLDMPDGLRIRSAFAGAHSALNILAALAAARVMGVGIAQAAPHLEACRPAPGRLCPRVAAGVTVIDDSYNANPASLTVALGLLREQPGRRWAVLGDMLELGAAGAARHRESGAEAAFVDGLITVGTLAGELGRGAVAAGLPANRHRQAADGVAAAGLLLPDLCPGDVVLVKASRGIGLDSAVEALLSGLGGDG
jgi:UDP-N-acetylmuramoyl-tripeptide--D-alanyl-D-alanine ligase